MERYVRTELLLGGNMKLLAGARVAVFGLGGVGSDAGIGVPPAAGWNLILVENHEDLGDKYSLLALCPASTIGMPKTEAAKRRIHEIDDEFGSLYQTFYNKETADLFDFKSYDYIVDAIDTVSSKLLFSDREGKGGGSSDPVLHGHGQ